MSREREILQRWPLSRVYRALHCHWCRAEVEVTTPAAMAAAEADLEGRLKRLRAKG